MLLQVQNPILMRLLEKCCSATSGVEVNGNRTYIVVFFIH